MAFLLIFLLSDVFAWLLPKSYIQPFLPENFMYKGTVKYKTHVIVKTQDEEKAIEFLTYQKDDKIKIESILNDEKFIIIKTTDALFSYYPLLKIAIKTEIPEGIKVDTETIKAEMIKTKKIKTKKMEKVIYEDWLIKSKNERIKITMWKEKNFPVKIVHETSNIITTLINSNIDFSANIPDEEFILPQDVKIISTAEMPIKLIPSLIPTTSTEEKKGGEKE